MTFCEKVFARTAGERHVVPGDFLWVKPDLVLMYDYPGISDVHARILRDELNVNVRYPDRCKMFIDHFVPPSSVKEADFHNETRKWTNGQGIELIENKGIGHQVAAEMGLAKPGSLIVHGDLHVHVLGALGALTISLQDDLVSAYALGEFWFEVPKTIRVNLTGEFPPGTGGRDLINKILRDLGPDGALGAVLEFAGNGAENMNMDERMSLLSEVVFCGAYTGVFPSDEISLKYLRERAGTDLEPVLPDPGAKYAGAMAYNLPELEPYVVSPSGLCDAKPIGEVAGISVQQGYIGSCANGRCSDLEIAARILKGRKIKEGFRLFVVPSSKEIMSEAIENQTLSVLAEAGAFISSPSCDYCYGKTQCLSAGETAISTGTLNVPGRMGSAEAEIYLGSAAVVAASAIGGEIRDPRDFL